MRRRRPRHPGDNTVKATPTILLLAGLLLGWPRLASAADAAEPADAAAAGSDESGARAAALAATRDGNRLLDEGKAEEALAKFQEAHRLVGGDKLRYNLGQAFRSMPGHELEAYTEFDTFLKRVPSAAPEIAQAAAVERNILRGKLASVLVTTTPPGALISVDRLPSGQTPLTEALVVRPGRRQLQLALAGYQTVEESLVLRAGQRINQNYQLKKIGPAVHAALEGPAEPAVSVQGLASRPATSATDEEPTPLLRRWWFWAAVGGAAVVALGVVALSVGGGSGGAVCPGGVNACQGVP